MEIQESNNRYLVIQDGQELYSALTYEEAQGWIAWSTRPDAGNPDQCLGC